MSSSKCKIFIGSSREASQIARALQHELRDIAESELWSQGLFRVGSAGLDDLVRATNGFDFGVFVFSPDDALKMRDKTYPAVRDNVLFELGLFVGKLGPERSFFVIPEGEEIHLTSDLAGIMPAKFDPRNTNLQVAVAPAQFEISRAIEMLGPIQGSRATLYDSRRDGHPKRIKGLEAYVYKGKERIGPKAEGTLEIGSGGELQIRRTNTSGRFEIQMRPNGPGKPSFEKVAVPPAPRALLVSCEAKVEGGTHTLRFVAKDEEEEKWLASETRKVTPGDWTKFEFYLWVDATRDFLFRIDNEGASAAPSTVFIRNLSIVEERQ